MKSLLYFQKSNIKWKHQIIKHFALIPTKFCNIPVITQGNRIIPPVYDYNAIESKWKNLWKEDNLYKSSSLPSKPKKYILDMFPYPSGSGLHVGHVRGYTASDVLSRYYRMKGYDILHPIGWDAFGLPAEQHAILTGKHPKLTIQENIENFRTQLKKMGFSYDW
jgi:leucyl-tRNA synthetase